MYLTVTLATILAYLTEVLPAPAPLTLYAPKVSSTSR